MRRILAGIIVCMLVTAARAQAGDKGYFAPVPASFFERLGFEMPYVAVPAIPNFSVSIVKFGAVGDGETVNAEAFERAIGHLSEQGGGRVIVPKGICLTAPTILQTSSVSQSPSLQFQMLMNQL